MSRKLSGMDSAGTLYDALYEDALRRQDKQQHYAVVGSCARQAAPQHAATPSWGVEPIALGDSFGLGTTTLGTTTLGTSTSACPGAPPCGGSLREDYANRLAYSHSHSEKGFSRDGPMLPHPLCIFGHLRKSFMPRDGGEDCD